MQTILEVSSSRKNFIQVFEFQKLRFDESNEFNRSHFDAMVLFNEKNQNKYFTVIHKGVQFNNYVGVIQIGGLTIEILPKADKESTPDKKLWQSVLLNMLNTCKHIEVDSVSETSLNKKYNSILDIYYEMFLNEVEYLIKIGLIKKYRRIENNENALKGKLLFSKNIQHNLIHKEKFYCENQVYDKDHLIHQIIYRGLIILKKLISDSLADKLNRIICEFEDIKVININATHFEKLILNRKNDSYRKAIDIAKMIILNYSPNLNVGNDNMIALLFDMNKLWEEYIFRVLSKHKPIDFSISYQNSDKFWESKSIRPDIVISDSKTNYIIDTKWKIIEANNPSDNDLKQMFVYNLHWKSSKSILLYPKVYQKDSEFGNYHYKHIEDSLNQCKIGFVSLIENNIYRKSEEIANEIFMKIG
ncbi:5-methylcytosine-specific restriction enzyme subunit McrC [Algoriella xinjiangensis]|uniref:5-methylcytosine-specific restriction enzyme subunit McrC n=1 Tax=Algoriella xinjiangensis TaxID=684065 RepID=A0A1I4YW18_9FLAO|nr:restriction endonuclease [Algoriella xinjiangensis]SFN41963.1 5-methylcytosine-specific restriction enzyme subunit McrC [Algoriella xinjiangensis]